MKGFSRRALGTLFVAVAVSAFAATALALSPGARAPEIGLDDTNGRRITIGSLRGKVVLVDIWASWCEPCREEMPVLERLYRQYRSQGFTVVAVSVDRQAQNIDTFFNRYGRVSFPVVHDVSQRVARAYGAPRMPSSYLIDRNGIVRHVHAGFRASDAQALEREIRALLAQR
jgi:peroxiredoxin